MNSSPDHPFLLRLLTVNIHKGFSHFKRRFVLPELRAAVRSVDADLVFLQEVQGESRTRAAVADGEPAAQSHYEFLADTLWPQFAYGRNAVYPSGDHGNAVLSKYPIVAHHNHDVSIGAHEARGLLHCTLRVPGVDSLIHAVCVHLGLTEVQRRHQMELLCRLVNQAPAKAPMLVAGDFNDWRGLGHRILNGCAGLREVFVHAHGRAAKTFPARFPLLRLDRIYVRNTRAHRPLPLPGLPWSRLSDHAPLAAEITL
ncbi:MAG: endonuclease/exonuclease/phosphatase family protein [Chitinophagaceae bacterium]|nr:endonuclease/exonuclease/phosphatase family protein [Rubrivivax sp.]